MLQRVIKRTTTLTRKRFRVLGRRRQHEVNQGWPLNQITTVTRRLQFELEVVLIGAPNFTVRGDHLGPKTDGRRLNGLRKGPRTATIRFCLQFMKKAETATTTDSTRNRRT